MKKIWSLMLIMILIIGTIGCTSESLIFNKDRDVYGENLDKPSIAEEIDSREETIEPPKPTYTQVKLLAVGDIMFHMPQINSARTADGTYDFSPPFKHVKKQIEAADIAIANFETVTAGNEIGFSGYPRFNSPIETVEGIKSAGFDIVSTINNHSLDMSKKGIINTIDTLNQYGLKNIGTFKDKSRPIVIEEVNGIKIGFVAYTSSLNGLDSLLTSEESYMINKIDESLLEMDVNSLKNQNVDIIIAYLHWGYEYHKEPAAYQVDLGRKMLEWGVDIILGSHPHTIQKTETIEIQGDKKLIIYSMGNFLSNQRYETMGNSYTEDGLMVEVTLEKSDLDHKTIIKEVDYIPTWVYRYRDKNKMHYEILPIDEALTNREDYILEEETIKRIEKSKNDTLNTINGNSIEK